MAPAQLTAKRQRGPPALRKFRGTTPIPPANLTLAFFARAEDKYKHAMMNRSFVLTLVTVFACIPAVHSQGSSSPPTTKAEYSQEAFVLERMSTEVTFDNEGNRTREQTTRVRLNTDAGIQHWGLLAIPFQSAAETVDLGYVRVVKPDGSIVTTPPDNIQDLDSQITRDAPFYSDLREKHVAVKGLGKGDILEYQVRWRPIKPLVPGQFWFEYNFQRDGIVLDERLEIKVPGDRAIKFKGPEATQTIKTDAGFRLYAWTYSRLQSTKETESDQKKIEALRGRSPPPMCNLAVSRVGLRSANGIGICNLPALNPLPPSGRRPQNSPMV
jgi:Domain of Unknown Function with PDB structure (DUF3857)